jgi:hypothetical protein
MKHLKLATKDKALSVPLKADLGDKGDFGGGLLAFLRWGRLESKGTGLGH